jgi:lysophospholipase L1-like esterase
MFDKAARVAGAATMGRVQRSRLAALALVLAGCGVWGPARIPPSDPRISYTGRFDRRAPDAVRFAWVGAQIEARFSGEFLRAYLTDTPVEDELRETDYITVVVDAGAPRTFALQEGSRIYPLATALDPGPHHVLIWKRTEAEVGVITFRGFELESRHALLPRPKPPTHRLEFVGDSITAGYGNEGADAACHWSAKTENNYLTFGAFAARELGASYTAVAYSGKRVTHSYEAPDELTLPEIYDRVIPTEDDSPKVSASPADVVVVNLGTNDAFPRLPDERTFTGAYQSFLAQLRTQNPTALFVIVLGPMLVDDYPQPLARSTLRKWLKTVQTSREASGDTRVDFIEFWYDPAEGVGCDFHPNVKTHARLGHELANLIRTRLEW